MSFSIGFIKKINEIGVGKLWIDGFEEKFESPLKYWSMQDYESQWLEAIKSVVDGKSYSYLITSMHDPQSANFLIIWPIYRLGNFVCFQNRLLFLEHLKKEFSLKEIGNYISKRETESDEGAEISEWQTDIQALKEYLQNQG